MLKKDKVACFTGHRPNKLPGGYDYTSEKNLILANEIENQIIELYNIGVRHFICGGALGVDQIAFNVLTKLRDKENFNITIEIAIPFDGFESQWPFESKALFYKQLVFADKITAVDTNSHYKTTAPVGKYHPEKMEKRNHYMVDHSQYIIAVFDGSKSGTYNCINYARLKNRTIKIINPRTI